MTKNQKQAEAVKGIVISYAVMMQKLNEGNMKGYDLWKSILADDLTALEKLGIKVDFEGINA
jgi:hypothetical protein